MIESISYCSYVWLVPSTSPPPPPLPCSPGACDCVGHGLPGLHPGWRVCLVGNYQVLPLFLYFCELCTHARTQTVSQLQAEQSGGMRCSSQCQCGQTTLPYCCKPDRRQSPYTPMYVHVFLEIALPLSCWTTGHFDKCRSKQSSFPLALVTKLFLCLQLHSGGAHRSIDLFGNVGNCQWLPVYVCSTHSICAGIHSSLQQHNDISYCNEYSTDLIPYSLSTPHHYWLTFTGALSIAQCVYVWMYRQKSILWLLTGICGILEYMRICVKS